MKPGTREKEINLVVKMDERYGDLEDITNNDK